ncbi:hypothetical protein J2S74_002868 [Evansella vedderi]|uniref:Type II secretion system protein GspF domain-containing protein n=1 Tax=Evansella vedderi TaxID=38282 RepID=A0ABT9ZW80_9BACI|nr:hypothetical protein [Evansella vedderi]MDQ0255486.1 hypothetical protein [Evansella vedderi]
MLEPTTFYKILPYIIYTLAVVGAVTSGYLVYSGLSTKTERIQSRLRVKQKFRAQKDQFVDTSMNSPTEELLKEAGYPLKLNAVRFNILRLSLIALFVINYIIIPLVFKGSYSTWAVIGVVAAWFLTSATFSYSLVRWIISKVIDFRAAKRNAELFVLYDLLISEIEMMTNNRVNTYNLIRNLFPYFEEIRKPIRDLLLNWNEIGPAKAIDIFVEDIGTKEAYTLGSVLKTLDQNKRETALEGLRSMNDVFVKSQIENYRRRRKLFVDLGSIPIKGAHFFIILNFIAVVVYMVIIILDGTAL